jgi:hypothetical protein
VKQSDPAVDLETLLQSSTNLTYQGVPIPLSIRSLVLKGLGSLLDLAGVSKDNITQVGDKKFCIYREGVGEVE